MVFVDTNALRYDIMSRTLGLASDWKTLITADETRDQSSSLVGNWLATFDLLPRLPYNIINITCTIVALSETQSLQFWKGDRPQSSRARPRVTSHESRVTRSLIFVYFLRTPCETTLHRGSRELCGQISTSGRKTMHRFCRKPAPCCINIVYVGTLEISLSPSLSLTLSFYVSCRRRTRDTRIY